MILLPAAVRLFVATTPINMRRSFEGLSNEVRCVLGEDPLSGHLFVFLNRRKNHVKMLLWTRGGFTILQKKLELGTFAFATRLKPDLPRLEVGAHELAMLLEGIDLRRARLAPRWAPVQSTKTTETTDSPLV